MAGTAPCRTCKGEGGADLPTVCLLAGSAVVPPAFHTCGLFEPHMAALCFSWLAGIGFLIQLMSCVIVTCSKPGRTCREAQV